MSYPQDKGQTDKVHNTGEIIYGGDGTNFYPIRVLTDGYLDTRPRETIQTELLACQSVAASTQVTSSVLSVAGVLKAAIFIDHGRASTAAFGTQGTEYRVEGSAQSSGNDTWRPLASVVAASAACLAVAASADVAASGTTVVVTSGTSIPSRGNIVFWANTVSAASSEWMKVLSVSGTASFVIEDGLTRGQDSDTNIFTQAEQFVLLFDVEPITRLRVRVNNNASGTTLAVYSRVGCITA